MSKLIVIPTPIGNLDDISYRAVQCLKTVDVLFCEDTRVTGKLLKLLDISAKRLMPYHKFNEHKQLNQFISIIESAESVGLVSDAGMPAISDPGYLLVKACIDHDIPVDVLPGSTAFLPAVVLSGLPNNNFYFEGFLPVKKGRQTRFRYLADMKELLVFYESPHKLLKTLTDFAEYFGADTPMSVSREISKLYEETFRGTVAQCLAHYESRDKIKGEFVLVLNNRG